MRGQLSEPCFWICVVCIAAAARAATYYVSNDGSDGEDGLSESTALKTIAAASDKVSSGDAVLFRRGDVFRETAGFGTGNTSLGAFGSTDDPLPVVSGSIPVTGWQKVSGNVYGARVSRDIEYLYVEGDLMRIARYPNKGWLRTESWTENNDGSGTVITTQSLSGHPRNANDYWNGANIRWHRHSWWFETREVVDFAASGHLTLADKSIIHIMPYDQNGWGFYLDNKLGELDTAGEWYYDSSQSKAFLWAPGNADPNDLLVEGTVLAKGLSVSSAAVEQICFRHQRDNGLSITRGTTVQRCWFEGIGGEGGGQALSATWDAAGSEVRHNTFLNNLNVAIGWNEDPSSGGGSIIENNELISTGTVPGYGGSGPWHAAGIIVSNATDLHIQYNRMDGTGYAGIILGSDGNFAEYNVIVNAMATLNDGGGIYTNCSRSTIRHNIILDALGGMESSGPWANISHGIWPEFLEDFRESIIENNTCAGCGGYGLFLPNNFECVIRGNVLYDNARAQMELSGDEENPRTGRTENLPQNHQIRHNVLYATADTQKTLLFRPEYDYGTLDSNYFCNPYTDSCIGEWEVWNVHDRTIAQWQSAFSWADSHPITDVEKLDRVPTPQEPAGMSQLFVNDTKQAKSFGLGGATYRDLDGATVSGSIQLEPFSSAVLVLVDGQPAETASKKAGDAAGRFFTIVHMANGLPVVSVGIDIPGMVEICVFRTDGRLVRTLARGRASAGRQRFVWDGRDNRGWIAANGIYQCVCRVSAGGRSRASACSVLLVR
ncbi:MAG: hypothetical protein GF418_09780 [Chitinivibrionales bacterium]|nr:hypothetical protein [Chitinivibrionales bacterium]MBD3395900.1 hypothetical protein [Chitinivibrionales bacterium]